MTLLYSKIFTNIAVEDYLSLLQTRKGLMVIIVGHLLVLWIFVEWMLPLFQRGSIEANRTLIDNRTNRSNRNQSNDNKE